MGQPEMEALWQDLSTRKQAGRLGKDEEKFFKKLVKVLGYLSADSRHNSLSSHEISDLSRKHGLKIFQSYLENNTPGAGRIFWTYGPDQGDITVLAVEPVAFGVAKDYLAPGNSAGQTDAGTTAWNQGGSYDWEIFNLAGPAGSGWDLLNITNGSLNLGGITAPAAPSTPWLGRQTFAGSNF